MFKVKHIEEVNALSKVHPKANEFIPLNRFYKENRSLLRLPLLAAHINTWRNTHTHVLFD